MDEITGQEQEVKRLIGDFPARRHELIRAGVTDWFQRWMVLISQGRKQAGLSICGGKGGEEPFRNSYSVLGNPVPPTPKDPVFLREGSS